MYDALVQAPMLLGMAGMFLSGHDPKDPLAAPIYADFTGVAPLYIQVGGYETLLDDAKRVAEAARRDGVDVTLEVFPEMQHVFQMGAGNVPSPTMLSPRSVRSFALVSVCRHEPRRG